MKLKKIIIAILLTIGFIGVALGQEKISVSVYQDARMLVFGDNKGNNAGTLNILTQFKMQGNQQKWGYMVIYPEFEHASLVGGDLQRYSINVGYVFNKLLLNNFEAGLNIGYGWIDRELSSFSASVTGNINYKLNDTFKLSLLAQLTDRTDIEIPELRISGFFGIEINLN